MQMSNKVTIIQSYRFPNNWTVQPLELNPDSGESDIVRIFTDRNAADGAFACSHAMGWCKENALDIISYQVQHQYKDHHFGFDADVEKIVLNEGKPPYFNGNPAA